MKKKTAWIKRMGTVLVLMCTFAASCIPVRAANMKDYIGLVVGYNSNEEIVYASSGIPVNVDGDMGVYAETYDIDSGEVADVRFVTSNGTYKMIYGDSGELVTGYGATIWLLEELPDSEDDTFLKLGTAHQNEPVTAVYLNENVEPATAAMTLLECSEDGLITADSYPEKVNMYYPAAVVNEFHELVGILMADEVLFAVGGGNEYFYPEGEEASQESEALPETEPGVDEENSGEAAQSEEKAPPLPSREEKTSGAENGTESKSAEETLEPTTAEDISKPIVAKKDGSWAGVLIGIAVAAAAAVAVIIFVIVGKSKKKKPETVYQGITPQVEDTGKTMPLEEGTGSALTFAAEKIPAQEQKLWLAAVGGYMNGRVYPVENNEITIGRDVSSAIRYPADTAGVSRVHAKLYWQNGQLMLIDCNSTSGTFLKRQGKLAPMQPVAVHSGDIFYIGEKTNSFEIKN